MKWPRMNSNKEWQQLHEDLNKILEVALAGTAEHKIKTLTTITYNMAREWFGTEERKAINPKARQLNQRAKEMQSLRKQIKSLSKRFREATEGEKVGIKDLTATLRDWLRRLRKAENIRKERKKKEAKRALFIKDPYRFTKGLLGEHR